MNTEDKENSHTTGEKLPFKSKKARKHSISKYEREILNELVSKRIIEIHGESTTFKFVVDAKTKKRRLARKNLKSIYDSGPADYLKYFWHLVKELPEPLITVSSQTKDVIEKILTCAGIFGPTSLPLFPIDLFPLTILVTGDTGVGKKIVAQTIHELRERSKKEIDKIINTTHTVAKDFSYLPLYFFTHTSSRLQGKPSKETISRLRKEIFAFREKRKESGEGEFSAYSISTGTPDTLIQSDLFGHKKGIFTDAKYHKRGVFDITQGTIFIDEIGDASPYIQAKLMEVLDERQFRVLGETFYRELSEDVIFVLATNKNLEKLVQEGEFREDLYQRINKIRIELPNLIDRRKDLRVLAQWFAHRIDCEIPDELIKSLCSHNWPGNVRELKNRIETACLFARSNGRQKLTHEDFPVLKRTNDQTSIKTLEQAARAGMKLEDIELQYCYEVWCLHKQNTKKAATYLGINRGTLKDHIDEYKKIISKQT